jgi:hypothetical protein
MLRNAEVVSSNKFIYKWVFNSAPSCLIKNWATKNIKILVNVKRTATEMFSFYVRSMDKETQLLRSILSKTGNVRNVEACSCNHCCSGKALHILSVCLWPLVSSMQCTCAILSFVACPALQYFSTSPHKRHDFRGGVIEHKMRALIFSKTFVWNISHSKKSWERNYHIRT